MYIPASQTPAAAGMTSAVTAPQPPPVVEAPSPVRITQLAVTGPGAALVSNTVNPRPAAASERNQVRTSQFLAQVLAQSSELESSVSTETTEQLALDLGLPEAANTELARGTAAYNATQQRALEAIITSDAQASL